MNAIAAIMQVTFKEGMRSRVLYAVFLVALLLFLATIVMSGMMMHDINKAAVDLSLAVISVVSVFVAIFVGVGLVAKDIDKRTIYVVLSKPISSYQYVLGKYFGLGLLLLFCTFLLSLLGGGSVLVTKFLLPNYFLNFSLASYLLAIVFIYLKSLLITSVVILYATFTTSSFLSLAMSFLTYVIGISLRNVRDLIAAPDAIGGASSSVLNYSFDVLFYLFPNFSIFDLKHYAAYGLFLGISDYICLTLYFVSYSVFLITISSYAFSRRQFF